VLPFANIGGDPEQEYFVDGVTESLTTDLSRISGAFVIARNTAFTFKGKAVDVKKLGRELNIRYVLEGSVQRGGNRLRVNVQLVDAETGNHLWAERFDKPVADLFEMQDEIVSRLANTLNAELIAAEARRAERSPHPDAMDLYFQGWASLNRGTTPANNEQAQKFFSRALQLDPCCVEALVGTAWVNVLTANNFFVVTAETRASLLRQPCSRLCPWRRTMPTLIAFWGSFKCLRTEFLKASLSAIALWHWIEIWPTPTDRSAWPNISLAEAKKRKPISRRHSASLLAMSPPTSG
jgi:TolB-like protein